MKKLINKKKMIFTKSILRIFLSVSLIFLSLQVANVPSTNSFFSDTASAEANEIGAGHWIPILSMAADPEDPDGDNDWYATKPCITLSVSVTDPDDTEIYYKLESEDETATGKYDGTCLKVGNGKWDFSAQAFYQDNPDWGSNIVSGSFKVDTICPDVDINNPDEGDTVSGEVEIRGTIQDENPDEYRLKIKNQSGTEIYDSGYVSMGDSFSNHLLYEWDTTKVSDGNYSIILKAKDDAGNDCNSDANEVAVDNKLVRPGDVVINEIMWMGSTESTADEWIELRNTTDREIDIGQWKIVNARHSTANNELMIPAGKSILANGYFLIANYPKTSSNTAINVSVGEVNNDMELLNLGNGNLILKDKDGDLIDEAKGEIWPAGCNNISSCSGLRQSMERKSVPGDGTDAENWKTCAGSGCNGGTYWKTADGNNYGTPGHDNI